MPYLMVNLDDPSDCRRAMQQLRGRLQAAPPPSGPGRCRPGGPAQGQGRGGVAGLPIGQRLRRIRHRGVWPYLVQIARATDEPRSLTEWDEALGLPANKMRSLKAIMAKLEHRFAIRFLVPTAEGDVDAAGNPRYRMPPRIRPVIRRLAAEDLDDAGA